MLKEFDFDEKLLIFSVFSLFLPFEIASICIGILLIYIYTHHNWKDLIQKMPAYKYFFAFIGLEFVVSLLHFNFVGIGNVGLFLMILCMSCFYRSVIHHDLFQFLCEMIIVLSIVVGIIALFEFNFYSVQGGYSFLDFHIFNSPKRRIHSTFMNANLYAMMLDFFFVICMYRFFQVKSYTKRAYYVLVAVFNFFILYLTGSRTALLPFVLIFPVFLYCVHWKKMFWFCIVCEILVCGLIVLNPSLIPRVDDLSTLDSRIKIWKTAFLCISMYPLFGWGPQTYKMFYPLVHGHKAPHAHNIYIDAILSYGIIGTIIGGIGFIGFGKDIFSRSMDGCLRGLILCFILIALVYGLLDCTLNIVATGMLWFLVLNSACMYPIKSIK